MNDIQKNIYEKIYTEYIEPIYGEKRNKNQDLKLITNMNQKHKYYISSEERHDFTNYNFFSIDPDNCEDADDGFSIFFENKKLFFILHIADPTQFIDINSDLWHDIKNRVTTKYLSNRQPIHLIPDKIIELSSLITKDKTEVKNTISIKSEIDLQTYLPKNPKILFGKVKVSKNDNFTYKKASLMQTDIEEFNIGLKISEALYKKRKNKVSSLIELSNAYVKYEKDRIYLYEDTKEEKQMKQMISEFAIFGNTFIASILKIGIYRNCNAENFVNEIDSNLKSDDILQNIINNGIKAQYNVLDSNHDILGINNYCHFTSPIRRLSDCICHYLLKDLFLYNSCNVFCIDELKEMSNKCSLINKLDKKNQYLDNKFRLLQIMAIMISERENKKITIEYFVNDFSQNFINIIINKIDSKKVYMSYSIKSKSFDDKKHIIKKKYSIEIHKINCLTKYENINIPELNDYFKY